MALDTGLIALAGTWLPAYGVPLRSLTVPAGYTERSPLRSAREGTLSTKTCWNGNRSDSQSKKKNVLSLPLYSLGIEIGPPKEPPKSFMISLGTVALNVLRAAKAAF